MRRALRHAPRPSHRCTVAGRSNRTNPCLFCHHIPAPFPVPPPPQAKMKLEAELQAGVYDRMDQWIANLKDIAVGLLLFCVYICAGDHATLVFDGCCRQLAPRPQQPRLPAQACRKGTEPQKGEPPPPLANVSQRRPAAVPAEQAAQREQAVWRGGVQAQGADGGAAGGACNGVACGAAA